MLVTAEREPQTTAVRLHRNAPWSTGYNDRLRRTYREWFSEHGERYFKVSAEFLNAPWTVEEINADGTWKATVALYARNLPAARAAIADHVAGIDADEIDRRMSAASGAPRGRASRRGSW